MSMPSACPVCGSKPGQDLRCAACGFPAAFIDSFADQAAHQLWQTQVQRAIEVQRANSLDHLRGQRVLSLNRSNLAVHNPGKQACCLYNQFGMRPGTPIIQQSLQVSFSDSHTVVLNANGTVTAFGNNDYQQCAVTDISNAAFVLAADSATYIVTREGRIIVRGLSLFTPVIADWANVAQLACSNVAFVALLRDGSVRIAATNAACPDIRSRPMNAALDASVREYAAPREWLNITHIAAAGQYILALTAKRQTLLLGTLGSPLWTSPVISIAAARDFALGLTADGKILTAGRRMTSLAPDLAAETGAWEDVVVLEAAATTVGAITRSGQLLLAGQASYRNGLIDLKRWDSAFLRNV